ncbi:MAG TPA: tripartite tricarboxylate transporter TctB family protein [Thermodesulfobacteriota bacterium]|nr:tripartite tricarboxylate transporter TctB family protein [Thermodesulfobacteriota bacterium]
MKLDRISGFFLFGLAVAVLIRSLTYPIGTLRKPGGGLFPLIAASILLCLSLILILQTFLSREKQKAKPAPFFPEKEAPKRIVFGFAGLLTYRYLLPVIGFGPATCVFIFLLSKVIGHYSWKLSVSFSIGAAVVSYYLFQIWLKIPMPIPLVRF